MKSAYCSAKVGVEYLEGRTIFEGLRKSVEVFLYVIAYRSWSKGFDGPRLIHRAIIEATIVISERKTKNVRHFWVGPSLTMARSVSNIETAQLPVTSGDAEMDLRLIETSEIRVHDADIDDLDISDPVVEKGGVVCSELIDHEAKKSRLWVAKEMGITQCKLSRMLSGATKMRYSQLELIAEVCGADVDVVAEKAFKLQFNELAKRHKGNGFFARILRLIEGGKQ